MNRSKLIFDWVLVNEIAIGSPPTIKDHYIFLKNKGIKSILNLCSQEEAPIPEYAKQFKVIRYELPDHKKIEIITPEQITRAIEHIEDLLDFGPVFIHCLASVERSPLICMAWLMKKSNLSLQSSLDYLIQVHKQTSPSLIQLTKLKSI